MIKIQSLQYDSNLDEFYDYEKIWSAAYGTAVGQFVDRGYISYHGTMSLDELMMEDAADGLSNGRPILMRKETNLSGIKALGHAMLVLIFA